VLRVWVGGVTPPGAAPGRVLHTTVPRSLMRTAPERLSQMLTSSIPVSRVPASLKLASLMPASPMLPSMQRVSLE
jgi:hypothetical protein